MILLVRAVLSGPLSYARMLNLKGVSDPISHENSVGVHFIGAGPENAFWGVPEGTVVSAERSLRAWMGVVDCRNGRSRSQPKQSRECCLERKTLHQI